MASEELQELLRLGPFLGMDATTAEEYVKPGFCVTASNVNTTIVKGALAPERGRTELFDAATFDFGGSRISNIAVLIPVVGPQNKPGVLMQGTSESGQLLTGYYDYSGAFTSITGALKFTKAAQYKGVVYTNGGQRFFVGVDNTKMYQWGYAPSSISQNVVINWTYAIATLGFNGSISTGDILTTVITTVGAGAQTINYTVKDTDTDFDILSTSIADAINTYYASGGGAGVPNKVTASKLTNFNMALSPGKITTIPSVGVLIVSNASGLIGNAATISVSSSAGSTEGYQLTGPTALGHFYGANTNVGNITGATYFYVFTQQTIMPDGTISETSVNLDNYSDPIQVDVGARAYGANSAVTFTDSHSPPQYQWVGTNADGTTYTTNIYRQSTNQPGYYLVGNMATHGSFVDTFSDEQIAANAQLQVHRDIPPFVTGTSLVSNPGFLGTHRNRMWALVVVDDSDTNNQPQTQLWYSNFDRAWEFNDVDQVLLVDTDIASAPEGSGPNYEDPYGNPPRGMGEVGTELILAKKREHWVVWGDGSTANPFVQKPIFSMGAIGTTSTLFAAGGEFFLSESGDLYFYAGGAPEYDSEDVRGLLKIASINNSAITYTDLAAACLAYSNQTVYVSFPTKKFTLGYSLITKTWQSILPYAAANGNGIASTPGNPATPALLIPNEVLAVRSGLPVVVDQWFADPSNDVGEGYQLFSWKAPRSDSGKPDWRKWWRTVRLIAPPKQQGSATVTLAVDGQDDVTEMFSCSFDLSAPPMQLTQVLKGRADKALGYYGQLSVSVQGKPGQPAPVIWGVVVYGSLSDRLTIQAP